MNLFGADEETLRIESVDRAMSTLNTAIPGIIDSFDNATQTASVIPAIKMKVTRDNIASYVDMPIIINIPVMFPYVQTAGFSLTLPVKKGDECLLVFSQRSIDHWHDNGGIQPPEQNAVGCRHHSLTDAFCILGAIAKPNVIGSWNATGIEIRNGTRDVRCTIEDNQAVVKADQSVLTLLSSGAVTCTAAVSVTVQTPLVTLDAPSVVCTGNLQVNGGISALGTYGSSAGLISTPGNVKDGVRTMAADRAIYNGHTHGGVVPGSGNTAVPSQLE